jgi:hypothetical protein
MKATEAKYGKFAYSASFTFSVPTGPLIEQMAPDSTLAISEDEGDTWKMRWKSRETTFGSVKLCTKTGKVDVPTLINSWSPRKKSELSVETTLIPPNQRWPDWHIRVHRITRNSSISSPSDHEIMTVEGGFAISGRRKLDGGVLPSIQSTSFQSSDQSFLEGIHQDDTSSLIVSTAGASGIARLSPSSAKGVVLKPDANTNLICQRTLIPTVQQNITFSDTVKEVKIVVAVYAVSSRGVELEGKEILRGWEDRPVVRFFGELGEEKVDEECVILEV